MWRSTAARAATSILVNRMFDKYSRNINYLRLSITDRCNLRCKYCMPDGCGMVGHEDILSYEEFLRLVRLFTQAGVEHVRVTGGEPLVRKGAAEFVRALKAVPGVKKVSLTTNGTLLGKYGEALAAAGLDSVNISLDTTDPALAREITGSDGVVDAVRESLALMRSLGVPVKLNAVLLAETAGTVPSLARFAEEGVPVRFIELMPMGVGKYERGYDPDLALEDLRRIWPDLHPVDAHIGSGPAKYYASEALAAPIGFIDAVSHRFCASCNRVRLTSRGFLKPCLCFDEGADLRALLRSGAGDGDILDAIKLTVFNKPRQHCFDTPQNMTESRLMSQIGG